MVVQLILDLACINLCFQLYKLLKEQSRLETNLSAFKEKEMASKAYQKLLKDKRHNERTLNKYLLKLVMYVLVFWCGPIWLFQWTPMISPSLINLFWGLYILLPNVEGEQLIYVWSGKYLSMLDQRLRKYRNKAVEMLMDSVVSMAIFVVQEAKSSTDLLALNQIKVKTVKLDDEVNKEIAVRKAVAQNSIAGHGKPVAKDVKREYLTQPVRRAKKELEEVPPAAAQRKRVPVDTKRTPIMERSASNSSQSSAQKVVVRKNSTKNAGKKTPRSRGGFNDHLNDSTVSIDDISIRVGTDKLNKSRRAYNYENDTLKESN